MASTLILNGYRYTTGGAPSFSTEVLDHPLGHVTPRDPNWRDGPWKLRYRLIDQAMPHENWMTMLELLRLVRQDEPWVVLGVHDGKLDTAMVRGSTVPLFRILDRAAVIRETILEAPPVERSKINRKQVDRWDKK